MKKFFKKLKKYWITVWLVVAVAAVSVFVVYASYTGIYSVKRVVSTKASAGVLFSSNSMQSYSGDAIPSRHITTSQESGAYTYNLTVCDFAQVDPTTRYTSNDGIPYTLTAQLYVKMGGTTYYPVSDTTHVSEEVRNDAKDRNFSIRYSSDGGDDVTSSNESISLVDDINDDGKRFDVVTYANTRIRPKVEGREIPNGTNKYAITFDGYELTDNQTYDYYVKVVAEPTNGDAALEKIACYLYLTKTVTANAAWSGRLQETGDTSGYDAYNFVVEGTGLGTVKVRWNSNFIDVNEIFIAQNDLQVFDETTNGQENGWKYFELKVGKEVSGTVISRYEIQLYKNNTDGDYSNVSTYISCTYTAD